MKNIFLTVSIILLFLVIYIMIINFNSTIDINYISKVPKAINLGLYTFGILFSGLFVGAGIVYMFLSVQNDKVKAYKRELEKSSIAGVNNASKVEVLEAKIKTLEKAFDTVIDERTKLEIQIQSLNTEIEKFSK